MTLKMVPVEFECYDIDIKELIFTVKAFDEATATVELKSVVNVAAWDEMTPMIRAALVALDLE
jgi:hypothetical protein